MNDPFAKMRKELLSIACNADKEERIKETDSWLKRYIRSHSIHRHFAQRDLRVIHDINFFQDNVKREMRSEMYQHFTQNNIGLFSTEIEPTGDRTDTLQFLTLEPYL